jgi:hypothetical protein
MWCNVSMLHGGHEAEGMIASCDVNRGPAFSTFKASEAGEKWSHQSPGA